MDTKATKANLEKDVLDSDGFGTRFQFVGNPMKLECHSKIDIVHDCSTVSLNRSSQGFLSGAKAIDMARVSLRSNDSDESEIGHIDLSDGMPPGGLVSEPNVSNDFYNIR